MQRSCFILKANVLVLSLLLPTLSFAIPVASYDTSVLVSYSVSSADLSVEASSSIYDDVLDVSGSGVASNSGSGDVGPSSDSSFAWSAITSGEVSDSLGYADTTYAVEGELVLRNLSSEVFIDAEVTFFVDLFAEIFSVDATLDYALGYAELFIEDDSGNAVYDDFLGFDSASDGTGLLSDSLSSLIITDSVSISQNDSFTYYLSLEVTGWAETTRSVAVPAPGTLALILIGLLGVGFAGSRPRIG